MAEEGSGRSQSGGSRPSGGGWITFPFITGAVAFLAVSASGWMVNLIVYLIEEFNVGSIDAAQINNIVNGCASLLPVLAAVIADSSLGCFLVASISSFISFLGLIMLTLTALIASLRPQPCDSIHGPSLSTSLCSPPSKFHLGILYSALALVSVGMAGYRFTLATMGGNQFHSEPSHQAIFFNWYFVAEYGAFVLSSTMLVYLEDNVSWGLGFGLCAAANLVGTAVLVLGNRYYDHRKPEGSPFTGLAQVVVAAIRKKKAKITEAKREDYYYGSGCGDETVAVAPRTNFRFFNRAALKTEGDIDPSDGSAVNPWRLCPVEKVEELKALLRILPLWSTAILLSTPLAVQGSMTVLQALSMDRRWGPHFDFPAGSVVIVVLISAAVSIAVLDRFLAPLLARLARKVDRRTPPVARQLRMIGIGHAFNVLGMVVAALVEAKRLRAARSLPVVWLFPQLILVGVGQAFHFPGHVAFYYQEFPEPLKGSATAMISLVIGIAYYLSTGMIDAVRRCTGWLPEDINDGRLDLVYWTLGVIGAVNLGYYVICARLYNNGAEEEEEDKIKAQSPSSQVPPLTYKS